MIKKKGFWKKYYEAKDLSGEEFYKKRFVLAEMIITSLLVVSILSIFDLIFYNAPNNYESQQTRTFLTLFLLMGVVFFYRHQLYNKRYKKNSIRLRRK